LPFSLVLPVATALKVLLSLAYAGFVFMCVVLRRHFGSDARLDWLFLPGFFGFAYAWGLLTFLVAAPIGLCFILVASRYAHERSLGRATLIIALGLVLLASHALVFVLGWTVGLLLLGVRTPPHRWVSAALPFAVLALACALLFLTGRTVEQDVGTPGGWKFNFDYRIAQTAPVMLFTVGYKFSPLYIVVAVGLCIPVVAWYAHRVEAQWRLGALRRSRSNHDDRPEFRLQDRAPLRALRPVLLPAYAWMFTTSVSLDGAPRPTRRWGHGSQCRCSWLPVGQCSASTLSLLGASGRKLRTSTSA
jgi:hypothetical protein